MLILAARLSGQHELKVLQQGCRGCGGDNKDDRRRNLGSFSTSESIKREYLSSDTSESIKRDYLSSDTSGSFKDVFDSMFDRITDDIEDDLKAWEVSPGSRLKSMVLSSIALLSSFRRSNA
jgi:hypothetical protein